jgi:hypothetical protein
MKKLFPQPETTQFIAMIIFGLVIIEVFLWNYKTKIHVQELHYTLTN